MKRNRNRVKEDLRKAIRAFFLYRTLPYTQEEVARLMTEDFDPPKPFQQYQISRLVKRFEKYLNGKGIKAIFPDDNKGVKSIDPKIIDLGPRNDGKITGDPRHKLKQKDNGDE